MDDLVPKGPFAIDFGLSEVHLRPTETIEEKKARLEKFVAEQEAWAQVEEQSGYLPLSRWRINGI